MATTFLCNSCKSSLPVGDCDPDLHLGDEDKLDAGELKEEPPEGANMGDILIIEEGEGFEAREHLFVEVEILVGEVFDVLLTELLT